jgi:hypothetical protein
MSFDYEKYQKEQITALGFDPEKLTEDQKYILLEPSEAPENYMCDGEISRTQAKQRWTRKMKEAGFTEIQIMNAKKKIGI